MLRNMSAGAHSNQVLVRLSVLCRSSFGRQVFWCIRDAPQGKKEEVLLLGTWNCEYSAYGTYTQNVYKTFGNSPDFFLGHRWSPLLSMWNSVRLFVYFQWMLVPWRSLWCPRAPFCGHMDDCSTIYTYHLLHAWLPFGITNVHSGGAREEIFWIPPPLTTSL